MKLLPLDTPELLELAASWLARKENYQWLDFGNGRQPVTPALLKIMAQRETHFLRVYTSDRDDIPIGIVGLNSVDRTFKTAMFWGATGEKSFRNRGYSTFASSKFLTLAFRDLGMVFPIEIVVTQLDRAFLHSRKKTPAGNRLRRWYVRHHTQ